MSDTTTAKKDSQKMAAYLRSGLGLTQTSKVQALLTVHGVLTLGELAALCDEEREELHGELKAGKVVLGDRSKLRRATADSIASWVTMDMLQTAQVAAAPPQKRGSGLSFMSKLFGLNNPNSDNAAAETANETANSDSGAPSSSGANSDWDPAVGKPVARPAPTSSRPTTGTGTLQGSPAWWKDHDGKMMRLAMAVAGSDGGDAPRYPWQQHKDSPDYHQLLWDRRAALLAVGFAKDDGMRKEWLALILELDATAGQSGPTFKTPSNGDYPWFSQKGEDEYKKTLLERRSQMLKLNLTQNPSLQSEWVLLMRELEATLQEQPQREQPAPAGPTDGERYCATRSTPIAISRDDIALMPSHVRVTVEEPSNDGKSASTPNSPGRPNTGLGAEMLQSLNGRSIQQWRTEVARTLRSAESMASLLSEASSSVSFKTADAFSKIDISRVASLASFYADSTRTEDFFSGSEHEDSVDSENLENPEDEAGPVGVDLEHTVTGRTSSTQSQTTVEAER